ncbi:Flavodoxin reductases (ferredoxin-NADPH reductases) family 1 [hydrothermal vent metagenome]|uniref:Flavodoxin reductases (Ferredoxin-NADPH reductases) family 1 n=1 Tax=hydrothermal vent metagenome TaxID=652676 RepID=A0A3B1BRE3_9ZZZZ
MTQIKVSDLAIYPVKSLAQIGMDRLRVERFGFALDRRWMVVDVDGFMITQRKKARMSLIQPRLLENGLRLQASDMPDLDVFCSLASPRCPVTVWEDSCMALDCGDEAAAWLSQFLDITCRLVFFPDDEVRQVDPAYAQPGDRTAFSDGFPILLISQASLDELNRRLAKPVAMRRFRPNLVVTGCEPFAEDSWKQIRIGGIIFRIVKPCSRCVIPNIDPDTAEKSAEPTRTLSRFRLQDKKILFGQNLIAQSQGELECGMPVEIIE